MAPNRRLLLCALVILALCVPVSAVATASAESASAPSGTAARANETAAKSGKGRKCRAIKNRSKRKKCKANQKGTGGGHPTVSASPTAEPSPTSASSTSVLPTTPPTVSATTESGASSSPTPSVMATSSQTPTPVIEPTPEVPATTPAPPATVRTTTAMRPYLDIFGRESEWSRDISGAPVASDSSGLVANLAQQVAVRYSGIASFNVWNYNVSTYTVAPGLPRQDVVWDNCQKKSFVPAALYAASAGAHFLAVPIPSNAVPAKGTDGELSIYDPATDQLWEFWKANKQTDGWHACWGGRIDNVSTSKGYFSGGMGVTATGLSATAGSIGIREAQALSINHAMSLNLVDAAHYSLFSYPAQRSDGAQARGTINAIREGQRFRLDPSLDVTKLGLTPLGQAVARAAQKFGFIVNDKGGAVALVAESGAGVAATGGVDPWTAIMGSAKSYNVLKNFPWSNLQALPLDYGK